MPSLKGIRKRISSVKNTQKITRAMKLVAAARLRRAQEQIIAARPYAHELAEVIAEIATRTDQEHHPLLARRPVQRVELLAITSDRGLAGAYNTNVNRATERFLYEHKGQFEEAGVAVVGRKGRDYLRRRKVNIVREVAGVNSSVALERATPVAGSSVVVMPDATDVFFAMAPGTIALATATREASILSTLSGGGPLSSVTVNTKLNCGR